MPSFKDHLNATYFRNELSCSLLTEFDSLQEERAEVQQFAERLSGFFRAAGIDARDVPVTFGRGLRETIPHILPGAWDGMVPSITYPNRHVRIDRYMAGNRWAQPVADNVLLDLGCGFPPITGLDIAARFPQWSVIALDPAHWPYMIIDQAGDRAVFDDEGVVRYFQPLQAGLPAWQRILRDKEATKQRFSQLLNEMLAALPPGLDKAASAFERDGVRLVLNPAREYQRNNLRFAKGDLLSPDLPQAHMARCFNVLCYYPDAFRHRILDNVCRALQDGGIFVTGADWAETMLARYLVYRKEGNQFVAKEFAFSLDNLRGSTNYFTLHDDDEEVRQLVRAVAALRRDRKFLPDFSQRFDALHAQHNVCPRGSDGYLGDIPDMPGDELVRRSLAIAQSIEKEGCVDRAVEALGRAGFEAWRNEAGHVAVTPECRG